MGGFALALLGMWIPFHTFTPIFEEGPSPLASSLVRVRPEDLPEFPVEGDLAAFRLAVSRQLKRCSLQNPEKKWLFGQRWVSRREWCTETGQAFLKLAQEVSDFQELTARARDQFHWYRSTGSGAKEKPVRFTGYYLPLLRARRQASEAFRFPLYRKPKDLVSWRGSDGRLRWGRRLPDGSLGPYPDRRAIDVQGYLKGKGLDFAYTDQVMDLYFMQVQGSGLLDVLDADGKPHRIMANYAGKNGRSYVSIRKILESEGVDPSYFSMQGLRRYFRERPEEIDRVLPMNPSYVFFQEAEQGPYGSGGTLLVPGHSIATDNHIFPLGALALVHARRVDGTEQQPGPLREFARWVVNQDTGGAIRGAGRVDIYWGAGAAAEWVAGHLNEWGELYFPVVP